MADKFQPAGNFSLKEVLLINETNKSYASILPAIVSATIIESINEKAITASLVVTDVSDTLRRFPLLGHELVTISWQTPSFKETESEERYTVFRVTRVTNVTPSINIPGIAFRIDLISEYGYHQEFLSIDEAFNTTVSEAVKIVHDKILSETVNTYSIKDKDSVELIADSTEAIVDFIIPSDTPFDTYDYFLSWAYSSEYASNVFYLFQNKNGINFRCIEKLIDETLTKIAEDKSYLDSREYTYSNSENITSERSQYVIRNIQQLNRNDLYSLATSGRLRNRVSEIDFVQKRVENYDFSYNEFKDKFKAPGKELLSSDDYRSGYGDIITENTWVYKDSSRPTKRFGESLGYKWAFHKLFYNNMLQLKLHGNSELTVGDIVKLNISSFNSTHPDNYRREDKSLSGYYLVKDITHAFTVDSYEMDVTVCRVGAQEIDDTEL